jgi:hypothetical protein
MANISKPGAGYGAYLDGLIPKNYQRREAYAYDPVEHHVNASRRPATGIPALDVHGPPRVCDLAPNMAIAEIMHMRAMEALQGLDTREYDVPPVDWPQLHIPRNILCAISNRLELQTLAKAESALSGQ